MYCSRRTSRTTLQASILVLVMLVSAVLSLAIPRRADAGTVSSFSQPFGVTLSAGGEGPYAGSSGEHAAAVLAGSSQPGAGVAPLVSSAPMVVTGAASVIAQETVTLNAIVNPNGGEVTNCEFEYGREVFTSRVPCATPPGSGTSPVAVSAAVTGLTPSTKYIFRISATNSGGTELGSDERFETLSSEAPTAVTGQASAITQTSESLRATVNPNGPEVTKCEFEYGTTSSYGQSTSCTPEKPGAGTGPVAVSAALTGLTANTTYHFRISATNARGKSIGADQTFKTLPEPPILETKAASSVTQTTATLNATVDPNGGEVSECKLEYGTTISYGQSASCTPEKPGAGTSPIAVSAAVTSLTANTTYHFRITATNAGGTSKGSDETFTTLPNPPTVVTKAASLVAQSSVTLNASVNPNGGEVSECKLEYGTTEGYGSNVPCASLPGSGTSPASVSASVTGLATNTTFHFRISATNMGGTSKGSDETFKTSAPTVTTVESNNGSVASVTTAVPTAVVTGLPAPVLARSANVTPMAGRVLVRVPGARTFVTLSTARQLSYQTIVDATQGEVSVTAATPNGGTHKGEFFDGKFVLTQGASGRVLATLSGGDFAACKVRARAARTHIVRRLWAESGGGFSTKGEYAGVIVQGAQWLTEDMCQGTLVLATRDQVEVADLVHHRHLAVRAGETYLAKAR